MEKIQLVVLGLSASPASNNAYALIMKELDGSRRLPIIIGAFEAQAIALEMEEVVPPRPMTHDLIKAVLEQFDVNLSEVIISDLRDGTFYAELVFDNESIRIDARPSDAIALAMRCNVPIFVNSEILEETGVNVQGEYSEDSISNFSNPYQNKKTPEEPVKAGKSKIEHLQILLDKAIAEENYERAADLRDEIQRLTENA